VTDNDLAEFRKEFLSEQQAADIAEKSVRTLRAWRRRGEGPPYIRFGKTIRYRKTSFLKHFEVSEIAPTRGTNRHRARTAANTETAT
jgi:hypothetical protein